VIDHTVDFCICGAELTWVDRPVEPLREHPVQEVLLTGVERISEPGRALDDGACGMVAVRVEARRGLAKEKLGRGVDGQQVEELLDVKGRSVAREDVDQLCDVSVEESEVCNLDSLLGLILCPLSSCPGYSPAPAQTAA
jgi:hypothetical protein